MKVKSIVEDGLNIFAIIEQGEQRRRYRLCRRNGKVSAYVLDSEGKPAWAASPSAVAQAVRRTIASQREGIVIERSPAAPKKVRAHDSRTTRRSPRRPVAASAIAPKWMGAIPGHLRALATPHGPTPLLIRLNLMQLLRAETF